MTASQSQWHTTLRRAMRHMSPYLPTFVRFEAHCASDDLQIYHTFRAVGDQIPSMGVLNPSFAQSPVAMDDTGQFLGSVLYLSV